MQFKTLALATTLALTSSIAFAQMGGGNATGADVPESSGTAVNGGSGAVGTVDHGRMINREPGATTGMSRDRSSGSGPYDRKNDTNVYQDQQRQGPVPEPPNPHGG
jgi:hypothetical protein